MVEFKDSSESSQKVVLYKDSSETSKNMENGFQHHCGLWSELSNCVKKTLSLFWFEETDTQMRFILRLKSIKTNTFNQFQPISWKRPHDHDFRKYAHCVSK